FLVQLPWCSLHAAFEEIVVWLDCNGVNRPRVGVSTIEIDIAGTELLQAAVQRPVGSEQVSAAFQPLLYHGNHATAYGAGTVHDEHRCLGEFLLQSALIGYGVVNSAEIENVLGVVPFALQYEHARLRNVRPTSRAQPGAECSGRNEAGRWCVER